MRPANDPRVDYKKLVRDGYDACASAYAEARDAEGIAVLEPLLLRLAPRSDVLDLGCGCGFPIARALSDAHTVTGVDFSAEQICLARKNVPRATFLEADITAVEFPPESFDAVLAFYVIFHLARTEQVDVLTSIWNWLKPGGHFLGTFSYADEEPYTENDFFGVQMYWTNFSLGEYEQVLRRIGFEIVQSSSLGHGLSDDRREENHPLVFARKPAGPGS